MSFVFAVLWCLTFQPAIGRTIAYYIWDGKRELTKDQLQANREYLNVYTSPEKGAQGFIMLEYYDKAQVLEVIGVRRPSNDELWVPEDEYSDGTERKNFCSHALPAVIRDFFNRTKFLISFLVIENESRNRVGSCKCYSRTMVDLGFNIMEDAERSEAELTSACTKGAPFRFFGTQSSRYRQKLIIDPERHQRGIAILEKSYCVIDHNPYGTD